MKISSALTEMKFAPNNVKVAAYCDKT